jgi:hypothetical protein
MPDGKWKVVSYQESAPMRQKDHGQAVLEEEAGLGQGRIF